MSKVMQWYHFDCSEVEARVSIRAVDEEAARGCLMLLLRNSTFDVKENWTLDSATYNLDGSPII